MKWLLIVLLLPMLARADVAELIHANDRSAAEIHARITAPIPALATNQLTIVKDDEVVAWEVAASAEISAFVAAVTGNPTNAVQRVGALTSVQMLGAVRQAKARANNAQRQQLEDMSDALMLLYQDAQRRGYSWPLPADFGQPTRTVNVVASTPGPSLWERRFPDQPEPTIEDIRNAISRKRASQ